jgi:GT2 family glycosyltransferase
MRITVAICTWRRYDMLGEAIGSAAAQSLPADRYEIVVVDNSPDEAVSRTEAARYATVPNLRWVHEKVAGLSNARNRATALADAPLIVFLDDDARAVPGWLESLCAAFDEMGEAVQVVGGRIRPRFGAPRPAWLTDRLLGPLTVVDHGDARRLVGKGEWVAGANIAFRTRAIREQGGFAVSLGRVGSGAALLSNEETDLTDRIKAAGGLVAYDPKAEVEHWVDPSRLTQAWFRRRMAWQAVSDYIRAPQAGFENRERAWIAVKDFLLTRNPADRTLRGLALQLADGSEFERQLSAIYNATTSLLAGLDEQDEV